MDANTFVRGLYLEHLEELGWLAEHRATLAADEDFEWPRLESWERRLETHLDALVLGGDVARELVCEVALGGGADALATATRLLARERQIDALAEVLEAASFEDAETRAVGSGLAHEWPAEWGAVELQRLWSRPEAAGAMGLLVGARRLEAGLAPLTDPRLGHDDAGPIVAWAMGRLRAAPLVNPLQALLQAERTETREAALLALLRMRHAPSREAARLAARAGEVWPLVPLALAHDAIAVAAARENLKGPAAAAEAVFVLGIGGDPADLPCLIAALGHESFAPAAAQALRLTTGANLREEVADPEASSDTAESPADTVNRLCRDPSPWEAWAAENRHKLAAGVRLRGGEPLSATSLVEQLESTVLPATQRAWAHDELVIGFDANFPFETCHDVAAQRAAVAAYRGWLARRAGPTSTRPRRDQAQER